MHKSIHAAVRCQQRGIPNLVIEWLRDFGDEIHDHQGGTIFTFTRSTRRDLERAVGRQVIRRMNEWLNAYIVVSDEGVLVTAGKRYKRIKH
ncbi:hypothetical protein [Nitrosomonas communis]|uniref:DUF4258 domain-containing protein n=1 Tax=Nitrosomonas communis TaxID=44574 RepID=A0A1I4RPH5_9PROT|nr:hypothetical protein [Nitrosomonas communis]SFM54172.1 hypothetical protein SAMN05421863_103428 [Nitrosomonas communis]